MPEDKISLIIKDVFKLSYKESEKKRSRCPSDEILADYVNSVVSGAPIEEEAAKHIAECDFCFSKAASAISALKVFNATAHDRGDRASIEKAKSIPRLYPKRKKDSMKKSKYLFIAAIFFILSFVFDRYFLQFLAAAVVFGFKWVMDTGGSKALIMIYDAWQHKKGTAGEEGKVSRFIKDRDV